MPFRPSATHWFETYVPREQTVYALEALATRASVELEADPRFTVPLDLHPVRGRLARFDEAVRRVGRHLPGPERAATGVFGSPEIAVAEATRRLEAWAQESRRARACLRGLERERRHLRLLEDCVRSLGEAGHALPSLAHRSAFLYKAVFACPAGRDPHTTFRGPLESVHPGPEHQFLVVAAPPEDEARLEDWVASLACRRVEVPEWLDEDPGTQRRQVAARLEAIDARIAEARGHIAALQRDPGLTEALANVALVRWYVEHADTVGRARSLCHVTGWTSESDPASLQQALDRAGIHAILRFAEPPCCAPDGPVRIAHGPWLRPFQAIVGMWGTPGRAEVDPTGLLVVVMPLLFGYMFPDVGHGAALVLLALAAARRFPQARILVPCGVSAMAFGVVFGEVLGFHDVIGPLWIRPLQDPLLILAVPMLFGVLLILLGIVFSGIEAHWRGRLGRWMATQAAVPVIYLSALAALVYAPALLVTAVAALWYLAGSAIVGRGGALRGVGAGVGHLLQSSFELGFNTLSFARVGAFTLAHAGLSGAILQIAESVESPVLYVAVLVLGNVVAIVVETLVVFVQITRLVLFEFFLRFLRAEGRVMQPLRGPRAPA